MTTWTPAGMVDDPNARIVSLIVIAAFLTNAAFLFAVLPLLESFVSSKYAVGFSDFYDAIAKNIANGVGYRVDASMSETMIREPGYPLFLAGVFTIGGYHIEAARVANLLLVGATACMLMRLARRVTDSLLTALITTVLFLLHPGTLISEARGGVEIAFVFTVMLFMLAHQRALEKGTWSSHFVAGTALGASVLVRSTPLFFPVALAVYLVLTASNSRQRLRFMLQTAVLVLGTAVVMSPWIIRNYRLVQEFVPTATVQGIAAQEGQYACQHLSDGKEFFEVQNDAGHKRNELARRLRVPFVGYYYQLFYTAQDEVAFNKSLLQEVVTEYRKAPTLFARCAAGNLVNFWVLGQTRQATLLNKLVEVPLLIAFLGGVYVLWKRGRLHRLGVMLTFVIYVVAVHAPIIAHARHSIPVVPFLMIPVGVSLVSLWDACRGRSPMETRVWALREPSRSAVVGLRSHQSGLGSWPSGLSEGIDAKQTTR